MDGLEEWENARKEKLSRTKPTARKPQRLVPMEHLLRIRSFLRETALKSRSRHAEFIADRDEMIVDTLRVYMLRTNEVLTLHWQAVKWEHGYFIINAVFEKSSREKIYYLKDAPEWYLDQFRNYLQKHWSYIKAAKGFLFPSVTRKGSKAYLSSAHWIYSRWTVAVKAAGLYEVKTIGKNGAKFGLYHPHQFRALGITRLLDAGLSPKKVQAFTQHACIETIMNYYWLVEGQRAREEIMRDLIKNIPKDEPF